MSQLLGKLDPAAERTMRGAIEGALRTQAIYVAATLGIADRLALGPRSAAELAEQVEADAPNLKRVMRLLVSHGVFVEQEGGRFALNRPAEYLQTGHPRSLRPSAIRAGEGLWEVASHLLDAVRSGSTPHDRVRGSRFFERLAADGKEVRFASRMSSSTAGLGEALAALPGVSGMGVVVDVGGGNGALLASLLKASPALRGVLFDTAGTVAAAPPLLEAAGVADRCELIAGDFFERVPPGGDAYLLSWILHDWNDDQAARILRRCREAGAAELWIVESLLPQTAKESAEEGGFDPFTIDLQMLLLTGGRERSEAEYRELLQKEEYVVMRVVTPPSIRGVSILQGRRNGR